ncbi:lysophospholipid acyltransferase family protein [Kangiella koreensis]|uniref:Phospholipid/glycerol acyltransferase n=1 Tax=Kangiella koreensis (strain DSM 16069 / JCM 12317 / KCTC 12182 / SW-125) TaxID=523791 RepID=C7R6E3_KANKD|nr:lysophospholipid acyltransferase family protein [Kangiella koreensis]ACV27371.1 phospholipid/glycerol acyltransferase [Kangiella koreensis DSM 16069]
MKIINKALRWLFFAIIIKPIVKLVIGLRYQNKPILPADGPALIIANHNSHLDTMVLISLLPLKVLHKVQPVAAADYFLKNKFLAWFALNIIGILPIERQSERQTKSPVEQCAESLKQGKILIFFPEGSRGEPESMSELKYGVVKLAEKCPEVPVYPIYMHGLGKSLPKGDTLLVPFFCDVVFSEPLHYQAHQDNFFEQIKTRFDEMQSSVKLPKWD